MDEERRRSEHLPRERVWDDQDREAFRQGMEHRRLANGDSVSVSWSRDNKGVHISGRDTIIVVLLAAGLTFVCWTNYRAFQVIEAQHDAQIHSQVEANCLNALLQTDRIAAIKSQGGACEYLWANH